jgi:hypothetical protein
MGVTGADILQKAKTRLGDSYVFGALTAVGAPNPHVFDCSKLASWAVYQAAKLIYGADNDAGNPLEVYGGTIYWRRDAHNKGKIVSLDVAAATPGAAVLRLATASLCGHIVISDGWGGTIEAACAKLGVIASTLHGRRWDLGILVPRIEYQTTGQPIAIPPHVGTIYRLTQPLMSGPIVQRLQEALKRLRPLSFESLVADGIYGPETEHAVAAFQRSQNLLVPDGEAGPATLKALGIK